MPASPPAPAPPSAAALHPVQRLLRWLGLVAPAPVAPPLLARPPAGPSAAPLPVPAPWIGVQPAPSADPGEVRAAVLRALFVELDALPAQTPADPEAAVRAEASRRFLTRLVRMLGEEQLSLPVFPDVSLRLDQLLRGPEPAVTEVAALVRRDPDLVRRVWQGARSAHFARGATSLDGAIARMGYDALWRVAMAACLHAPVFRIGRHQARIERNRQHGLVAAELCAWLSDGSGPAASMAALLHKGGVLMILRCLPPGPPPDRELLHRVIQGQHAAVGLLMAHAWKLGRAVATGIGFHPLPGAAPVDQRDVAALVHASSIASHSAEEALAGRDCGGLAALQATPGLLLDPEAVLRRATQIWRGRAAGPPGAQPSAGSPGARSSA